MNAVSMAASLAAVSAILPLFSAAASSCSTTCWGALLRLGGEAAGVRLGDSRLVLRGGGNALGANGEAITEEQAGEELIKASTANNIAVLLPSYICSFIDIHIHTYMNHL